jgi:hypothetical protein
LARQSDPARARARRWQNANGGWGETYKACVNKAPEGGPSAAAEPVECYGAGGSGVVQTAWALLGLMAARPDRPEEVLPSV